MAKVAQLPPTESAPPGAGAEIHHIARAQVRYYAFLSYSHRDEKVADWLHRELERFRVPAALAGKLTEHGVVPKRLTPIFRDRHELAAADDLGAEIRSALAASQYLVVLCSPDAARSRWTNAEIEEFKKSRPEGCVLAAIVSGEPFASDIPGREAEECFPPALRFKYDRRGHPTAKRAEPLAADLRETGDGRRMGFLKLVAGMLGVGLDDLVQREATRRQRRLAMLAAGSLAGMAVTSTLAVTAIQSRNEAREQRRQAEGLVGFMLGDLKEKLEPIGRLDALDAVGSRALAYYQAQDKSELSDEALAQRARALTLMGEIANTRGDLDGALGRYREAMASTEELARRYPDDPQRLFDHAQNVFWVGEVADQRGQTVEAERAMREYKSLADRMVGLDPGNRKWQLEVKYANSSLAALLYKQRRYAEASRLFQQALRIVESLSAAEPGNTEYKRSTVETLGWLADSRFGEGLVDDAIAARERQAAFLDRLIAQNPVDASYRQQAIPANWALGRLLAENGDLRQGVGRLQKSVALGEQLLAAEPENADTIEFTAGARFDLARVLAASGRVDDAAAQVRAGCDQTNRLLSLDQKVPDWRRLRFECALRRAEVALRRDSSDEALALAGTAVAAGRAIRQQKDIEGRFAAARAYSLIGDIRARQGNRAAAAAAWRNALATWPAGTPENPSQTALRMHLLHSLGQTGEAGAMRQKLAGMGYRELI
jgi:tetratricopeptide (TPR) repeat protein